MPELLLRRIFATLNHFDCDFPVYRGEEYQRRRRAGDLQRGPVYQGER